MLILFSTDFMSLEIDRGYARLLMDYGSGTVSVEQRQIKLTDGKSHKVDILWSRTVSCFPAQTYYYVQPYFMSNNMCQSLEVLERVYHLRCEGL